ncbi:metabotropic glutamate receptor 3 [Trichonephila clavata]|uniref:Metabotropic glutamate receptor 3 n=1 Tax=Trichonephila clavata TaxID=2740835 RepID=A0A8X6F696_TRICU|nr:metabotropic glutamate receptor 3 [Trichonephila clavata]
MFCLKVLAEVVHDMDWERVAILHADDEYSIFVTKVFSQIAKSGYPCIAAIRSLPVSRADKKEKTLDPKSYHRMLTSFTSKLSDKTGVIVIGHDETFKMVLHTLMESQTTFSRLQWLFSWMPSFSKLDSFGNAINNKQMFSLSPFPPEIFTFEDYWRRLGDTASIHDANDRFFMEYAMSQKNCRIAGYRSSTYNNIVMCDNLILKETQTDKLMRTARFLPALHSLYTFAHAYRKAWSDKCKEVPGMCLNLRRMTRREFVEMYLEPLEFEHDPQGRSPQGVHGQKTGLGASGEMEGMQLALNTFSFSQADGLQVKQVLAYDSKEAKVLDTSFRYIPSGCPKGGCKDCISVRQSRFEDPYIGMPSITDYVTANQSDEISIPILLPIHKAGQNPLECSEEINAQAVQDLEAALWTVDQINRDTEFLPEIRLGVVVVDTCSTPVQITQKLSNYLLDTKKKDLEDFSSDLAFVVVGSPEEIEAASSIISPLNVTTISVTDSIRLKNSISHHLQVAIPFEKKIKATVDTLRYLGWNYVTVIHDNDRRSAIMVESFKTYIKESDICISVELSTSSIATDLEMDIIVKQVVAAKKKGARAVVMWTSERSTKAFLRGVHRAVIAGQISRGDLVIISSGDWIVNLQSFKEFENEATGVIVLKTQQGEVEDFATYYQRLQPEANKRNPWFHELWEQRKECKDRSCDTGEAPIEYTPSSSTVNIIQGLLAISAGLARLRNELCHPEPGLCPKMLQTPQLREHLFHYIRETASSRLDAKGEMFAFTKQGYGNLPIEIFNFRRAAGKNFVYQKVGTYDTHLNNLAEIVVYNSDDEEMTVDKMTSECLSDCGVCEKRPTDFVILDSKDHLYLATSVDIHDSSSNPLTCGATVTTSGLQTLEAFLWALDQINSNPQILPGVNLGAIIFDTCSSKEKAARDVANFFSSSLSSTAPMHKLPSVNQILGLVATQTDNVIQPIIDVAMPFKMMTLAPRVTSTNFNDAGKYPSLLRPSLPNDVRAGALVDLLKHFKWDYVSVLYSDVAWKEMDMFKSFKNKAEAREVIFAVEEKISPNFPKAAMKILINKLQESQKKGARVVVLFLNSKDSSDLFAAIKEELDAGRMEIGDFVWVTFESIDAFHQYPLVSLGAVMMQPGYSTVFPFKQYFSSLVPRNNSRNPWFRDYWEQVFKCRGTTCDHSSQNLAEMSLMQDASVSKVINSVLSVGVGLEALRQNLCPGLDRGLCPAMTEDPHLRELLLNLTRETSFAGADGKLFKFTNRRFSANTLDVLNFRQVGSNAHAFVNVGTYSPDEGLSLNFSKIRTYNEFGKEISLYDIKSVCKDCRKNAIDKFTSSMQIVPKQDFSILAMLPVHRKGTNFFDCGDLRDDRMFHHLVGIAYAIDKINKNSTLMPGVEIGALVFDYCDRPQRGEDQVYSFFSKDNDFGNGLRIKPKSVIAAMTYGTEVSKESAPIFDSLNVMQIASPIDRMDSNAFNDILYTAPSTMSQIQALLSILRKFNWMYVNIVYSNTDFGRSGYYQFAKEAKETGVCLAHVVIVEPHDNKESLLTNLQNGLNRDATVVVSLVDDDQVVQNMVEAIKISTMLSKYVWIGTETWGNNPTVMNSLQDATFDALTLKLESHDIPEYKRFYESLTLWNHYPIPDAWFEEFWQHRFQCQLASSVVKQNKYARVCSGKEQLSSDELSQNEHIYQTVKTIQSVTEGLRNYLSKKCPYGMAAMNIDDCGKDSRTDLQKEIQILLHGAYSDCEECSSSSTIFGYDVIQHAIANNASNVHTQIGSWKDGILFVEDSRVAFSNDLVPVSECKEDCGSCQNQLDTKQSELIAEEPIYANFQTVWGIIVTALSILGILLVIICALYFLMSFPVTVGTTVLGYMILFGLLLLYAVNFAFVLSSTEGTCGIRRFGLGLAYAVIFSGMLVKVMNTWRLMGYNGSRILSDGTRLSSPAGLLVIAVGLVIIQIVLSSAWLILMPPKTGAYEQVWRCAPPTTFEEGLVVSLIYVMLLLAITTLFAILTWQCQDNNRESRWILACAILVAVVWMAWTILSTQLSPHYRDTTIACANLVNATIIMIFLYLRKVYLYSKLTRQARDQDLKAHLQPTSYSHSIYGSSQKTFSTLAPVLYGSQASLTTKKLYNGPSSRVELINCPEDNKSDSSGSVQVQATDLYPLDMSCQSHTVTGFNDQDVNDAHAMSEQT